MAIPTNYSVLNAPLTKSPGYIQMEQQGILGMDPRKIDLRLPKSSTTTTTCPPGSSVDKNGTCNPNNAASAQSAAEDARNVAIAEAVLEPTFFQKTKSWLAANWWMIVVPAVIVAGVLIYRQMGKKRRKKS